MPDTPAVKEASAGAPIRSLRNRAEEARHRRFIDRPVPGYDPAIVVRYRALDPDEIEAIEKKTKKLPLMQRAKLNSARVAIAACLGIFDEVDGKKVSVDPNDPDTYIDENDEIVGKPVIFTSPRLAELLEIEGDASATKCVFELYAVDGDVIRVGSDLVDFSGMGDADVEEMIRGNS